jgi:succinate dehydrogenase / fumarate reductase flavoprotein subunit
MVLVSECIAKAALEREESRGGHTREDHPGFAEKWGTLNIALSINAAGDGVDLATQPLPVMPDELATFFQEGH